MRMLFLFLQFLIRSCFLVGAGPAFTERTEAVWLHPETNDVVLAMADAVDVLFLFFS
jgi:hypothetical protein